MITVAVGLDCSDDTSRKTLMGGVEVANSLPLPQPGQGHTLPQLLPANDRAWLGTKAGHSCPMWTPPMGGLCSGKPHWSGQDFFRAAFCWSLFLPNAPPSFFPFTGGTLHHSRGLLLHHCASFTGLAPNDALAYLILPWSLLLMVPELTSSSMLLCTGFYKLLEEGKSVLVGT